MQALQIDGITAKCAQCICLLTTLGDVFASKLLITRAPDLGCNLRQLACPLKEGFSVL